MTRRILSFRCPTCAPAAVNEEDEGAARAGSAPNGSGRGQHGHQERQHSGPRAGNRRLEPGRGVPNGYPLFHTYRPSTAIQWLTCASCKSFTDPYTGHHAGPAPGRRDRGKLARLPRDRLRARGLMARGLGRISHIRGTLRKARDDMPAGRYPPKPGPTGLPTQGTGGKGKGTGSPPNHRSAGLAPGVLGWPWHPRRLVTARYRGDKVA